MIEFKRTGDAMVFECPSCFIEVSGDSHRIKLNREYVRSSSELLANLEEAFKVLDMMTEHKMRRTNVLKVDFDIAKGEHVDIESMRKRFGPNYTYCGAGK